MMFGIGLRDKIHKLEWEIHCLKMSINILRSPWEFAIGEKILFDEAPVTAFENIPGIIVAQFRDDEGWARYKIVDNNGRLHENVNSVYVRKRKRKK